MKKLISLILCVVVILTFAVPAFAADAAYNFAEDASMKYTIPTKYDSVLRSQTGEYAMICGDVIQPVGRMELPSRRSGEKYVTVKLLFSSSSFLLTNSSTYSLTSFGNAAYNFAEDASMKYTIPTKYDSVLRSQTGE